MGFPEPVSGNMAGSTVVTENLASLPCLNAIFELSVYEEILERDFKSDADIECELRALLEQIESFQQNHKPAICES